MTAGQARALLGLPPDAGADALGRAYRSAVKAAHPDLGGDDPERLRQVIEAHRLLKSLGQARMMFPPAARPTPERSLSLKITLREAMAGGRRRLKLKGGKALDVRLPKGLRPGDVLRLTNAAGGDVLVHINVQAGAGVTIRGDDLWLEVMAGAEQIKAGTRFEVDTPRGRRSLVAPEGAAEGRPIRLKGQGLPAQGGHPVGDLILKLTLDPAAAEAPAKEPASKKLLRRFSARWAA